MAANKTFHVNNKNNKMIFKNSFIQSNGEKNFYENDLNCKKKLDVNIISFFFLSSENFALVIFFFH